jgi:inner membrane transporter RhtA
MRVAPRLYFLISALFHYLGPACAVLLFAHLQPLGVAWLRILSAAAVFALWRRPWRCWPTLEPGARRTLVLLGAVLAAMNSVFYLAIARLPLATVGALEFLGPITLAAAGMRSGRNYLALALAAAGVAALTRPRLALEPLGLACAFLNCGLFVLYIVLGHRLSRAGAGSPIDRLGLAMLVATLAALPVGLQQALPAFTAPRLLLAATGVGICSSVVPYVCDQLAMAALPRATFALWLALLPATATAIGILVLGQWPSAAELAGITLVMLGLAVHREPAD